MRGMVGDVDKLRSEREARKNPPTFEVGQGDDAQWDFLNDSSVSSKGFTSDSDFKGSDVNLNGFNYSMPGDSNVQNTQNSVPNVVSSEEEMMFNALVQGGKGLLKGAKDLIFGLDDAIRGNDVIYWATYGRRLSFLGLFMCIVAAIFGLFSIVTNYFSNSFWLFIAGIFTGAPGIVVLAFFHEKSKKINKTPSFDNSSEAFSTGFDFSDDVEEDEEEDIGWGNWNSDEEDEDDTDDLGVDIWSNLSSFSEDEESETVGVYEEDINIDAAIDSITDIPAHTYTRMFLFEEFSKVLPILNPNFAKLRPISTESDNFVIFDKFLQDAAIQVGTKEDKIPELQELRENQFIIQLKATRPSGIKEDDIAREIADIYSRDDYGIIEHEGVYATTSSVGGNYIINIFKGEDSTITLADAYREAKDFVLNPKISQPVIIGIDEFGRTIKFDAENIFSFLISGKSRWGKSWTIASLIVQLCMYSSPKEINFEVFDTKGTGSDYYKMSELIPHFRRFESKSKNILSRMRYLATTESERRRRVLQENDCLAIADLKSKRLDAELPYLYVIMDEIVNLVGSFNKEENAEYRDLLNTLSTKTPSLGIRLILVPHRVTNEFVPKTTYTNMGFTCCLGSDMAVITSVLGIKEKDFPYTLANKGDAALRTAEVNKGKTVFSHSVALTTSNDNNVGLYRFIGSLWNRLEPTESSVSNMNNTTNSYKGHNLFEEDDFIEDFFDD